MQDKDIKSFLVAKRAEISKLRNSKYGSREFESWRSSLDMLLCEICGEQSKEYRDFTGIHFFSMMIGSDMDYDGPEEHKAYLDGLNKMEIFLGKILEKIELFGVFSMKSKAPSPGKELFGPEYIVQNFYLNQHQIQNINQRLNIEALDPEVREKVEILLEELKKKQEKNKVKIGAIIKWLADKSIDILIALLIPK